MAKSAPYPLVLVLLATYNASEWLLKQFDSIVSQKNVSLKILVRDDGSNDNTRNILRDLESTYDFLSCIYAEIPSGSAGANFRQLILSSNLDSVDYVAFCDQDDIWIDDKLTSSIDAMKSSGSVGFSSSVLAFWPDGKEKKLSQSDKITDVDFLFEGAGQGCTFLISSDFFSVFKSFCCDNQELISKFFYHDWMVYLMARALGKTWHFSKKATVFYRQHSSNETGGRVGLSAYLKRFSMIKSGWYKNQINCALEIFDRAASSKSLKVIQFSGLFKEPNSLKRRVMLTVFLLRHGRRRLSDRLVLAFSVLVGYI